MAPIMHECRKHGNQMETIVCATGQHRQLLDQVTEYFGIEIDRSPYGDGRAAARIVDLMLQQGWQEDAFVGGNSSRRFAA